MATLQKQKGKYWYIVESRRVNGKPRPVPIAYLGKAEDILEKLSGKKPVSSKSYEFGVVATIDHFIKKLDLISLIESIVFGPDCDVIKRNGISFGETIALIIIHRAVHPGSKRSFSKWAVRSFLPEMYNFNPMKITSQHFWDMMNYLSEDHLISIERELTRRILSIFKIDLDLVLYDYTNFFTFIDTNNKSCTIAQRGKNKQKRSDLRQFSLAMLVIRKHRIPLFSHIYEGNKADCNEFKDTIGDIQTRLQGLASDMNDVTIVFDKGSNSKENFQSLGGLNYVASLSVEHDAEIKNKSFKEFYNLEIEDQSTEGEIRTLKCYRMKKDIWGEERTIVIYKSDALFGGQLKGLKSDLSKVIKALDKLRDSGKSGYYIKKGNKKTDWTFELFQQQVEQTINKRFCRDIVDFKISRLENQGFGLTFNKNIKSYNQIKKTALGKVILITSRHEWSDLDIINAYHGQADVERFFRQIKNPFHNSVRPNYHWTDQKIKVHTFCSILSLTISSLIEMVSKEAGFSLSCDEIYYRLEDLRKAKYIYKGEKKNSYEIEYRLENVEDPKNLELFNALTS